MIRMKSLHWESIAIAGSLVFVFACQAREPSRIVIINGKQISVVTTDDRIPGEILKHAGVLMGATDQILFNGILIDPQQPLPTVKSTTLQIRHTMPITLNDRPIQTTAESVGDALSGAGIKLYGADRIEPTPDSVITNGMAIRFEPSQEFLISIDSKSVPIRSSMRTIGSALAQSGYPLVGLDTSKPSELQSIPTDGSVTIGRVSESVVLAEKLSPYKTDSQASALVELDHEQVLQPGQAGLVVNRTRIRYEDGKEVSRKIDSETVVRSPTDRILGYGTNVVVHTSSVDGVQINYWRTVQVYATSYSPCRSDPNRCYPGTSSGLPVQKGVVAVSPVWYSNMVGQQIYVTGYGKATIADLCNGCVGKLWIDLGYSDNDYVGWGSWVTIYFLAPPPSNILYLLQ